MTLERIKEVALEAVVFTVVTIAVVAALHFFFGKKAIPGI